MTDQQVFFDDPAEYKGKMARQNPMKQAPDEQKLMNREGAFYITPNNHFRLALFVLMCCSLPLGILALIKSNEVKVRMAMEDFNGAMTASKKAKWYAKVGICLGILGNVVLLVMFVFYAFAIKKAMQSAQEILQALGPYSGVDQANIDG